MAGQKIDIEISAKLDQLDRDFSRAASLARETSNKIEGAFGNLSGSLKGVAGGLVAAFSVDAFKGMIMGAVEAQDHINDLSKSTSLSVETLAGLGSAAIKSGSNLDDVAASINKLSVNMGKEPEKFRAIGVSAKDPIEAFKQLADVFVAIKDPQERAAFAAAALGKSWAGTAPLLSEGGKAIGEMVEKGTRLSKITTESAKAADELNDRLSDLETASQGVKAAFVNLLVPTLTRFAEEASSASAAGLSLWGAITGIGMSDPTKSPATKIRELTSDIEKLNSTKARLSANNERFGTSIDSSSIDDSIAKNKKLIEYYKERQRAEALRGADGAYGNEGRGKKQTDLNPNTRAFIDGPASKSSSQISEGQRLIEQLKDRLLGEEKLTEVQKLEAQFADDKYKKISAGEKSAALGVAAQIDARKALASELDAEIARINAVTKEYDAQDARLKSLIASTDIGKTNQTMQDEALAESAFMSGKIDTTTYDQIIAKLHEVKDEGKGAFSELQSAIEGWGKSSAEAIVDFCSGSEVSFKSMVASMLKEIAKMMIYKNVTKPIADNAGTWISALLSSATANANGGVYDSPSLSAYSGGVYSSPQFFKFASGAGVFGEAGPEAIMPLSRGADGKLGVKASGSSGTNVAISITVNEASGASEQASSGDTNAAWTQFAGRIKAMIIEQITTEKRPGGLLYA